MAHHSQANFSPVPPIRTNTVDSQRSQSSGQMSPPFSPTSPTSPSRAPAGSPTEASFFGAITARIRGRSRSRSRDGRQCAKAPMMQPPEQIQTRPVSYAAPPRPAPVPVQHSRPSLQHDGRRSTSGSDPWRGRHSNDWLFNGYSVTATAKDLLTRRKS